MGKVESMQIAELRARRYSPFNEITDFELLEKMEQEAWERYDLEPTYEIKEQLFYLNLRMWELKPEKEYYRNSITKLVLELGWDLKRSRINYEQAYSFFEDLITLQKPRALPIANYRLGFIDFYNKKYQSAIRHFEKALSPPRINEERRPLPHEMLNDSQRMKAQAQLAVAYAKYSVEAAVKARKMYDQLGDPDEHDLVYIMILENEILKEEEKPYTGLSPVGKRHMTEQQFRGLKSDPNNFILDCTNPDEKRVYILGRACRISPRRMAILEVLFTRMKPVPQRELSEQLNMPQVSRYMNELKEDLARHGLPEQTIIADNGYRLQHPKPLLIYNANDPKYMM
jgi:tetratricopeptide (TPR) repeat protein